MMHLNADFDVIVIGGGHAGSDAASASARMGANTALITHNPETIGVMSCNPAIGGLGKGHIVREIDAFDGVMGRAADASGIQFRMLNQRKGPAVRGPRAQSDRALYKSAMQEMLSSQQNLHIISGAVADIIVENGKVAGVVLEDGRKFLTPAVVLTTGTFLNGVIHIGKQQTSGGRVGEKPSIDLSKRLYAMKLPMGRLKTGTPARIYKDSINWSACEEQPGDDPAKPFSFLNTKITVPQISCYITRTTAQTHKIISDNIGQSAMYSGNISGRGPRYCPSIEDKVSRFADKESHQIFLEPEGLTSDLVYPNGISTSLPIDVQEAFMRTIPGLVNVKIATHAYAIEYDFIDPQALTRSLMLRSVEGFFLAGQINGTTGYEEAAGQGLVAGLNAALYSASKSDYIFDRTTSYIGVMIDDLVSRGVSEPYRMFTSRAEYRLSLRADNADQRLTPEAIKLGCASDHRQSVFEGKMALLNAARMQLKTLTITPNEAVKAGLSINQDGQRRSAYDLLSYSEISFNDLKEKVWPELSRVNSSIIEDIEIEALYARYMNRQESDAKLLRSEDLVAVPKDFDYSAIAGLSAELKQKLISAKPMTLADIKRIEGITPSAVTLLLRALRKSQRKVA
jgi:tRNA uridine 5-carboxymethylaminomethyl modification enzyme